MTTAAEALVRDCANRLDQLFRQDYTMREVEAELRRLLRATQSNGRLHQTNAPDPQASGNDPSESPAQSSAAPTQPSAPVQEPVRYTMWSTSDGYVNPRADPEGAWVLYAAPPPDEARELMQLLVQRYDDYRGKGVMPAPGEYQMVVGAIERIRAFLKDRT